MRSLIHWNIRALKHFSLSLCALSLVLAGCGGGGDSGASASASQSQPITAEASAAAQPGTMCGYDVGPNILAGILTGVQSGDTITVQGVLGTFTVRMEGIDAPDYGQPNFSTANVPLVNLLGAAVRVAYTRTDRAGNPVGSVFINRDCQYLNLDQVKAGRAWFYKAYRCELPASLRNRLAQAQDAAYQAHTGLWSEDDPEAPWFYRTGVEPATPTCAGDAPTFIGNYAMTSAEPVPTSSTGSTSTGSTTSGTGTTTTSGTGTTGTGTGTIGTGTGTTGTGTGSTGTTGSSTGTTGTTTTGSTGSTTPPTTGTSGSGTTTSTGSTGTTTTTTGTGRTTTGKTCYVGPRGGTYTLTSSGKKDYSGC